MFMSDRQTRPKIQMSFLRLVTTNYRDKTSLTSNSLNPAVVFPSRSSFECNWANCASSFLYHNLFKSYHTINVHIAFW